MLSDKSIIDSLLEQLADPTQTIEVAVLTIEYLRGLLSILSLSYLRDLQHINKPVAHQCMIDCTEEVKPIDPREEQKSLIRIHLKEIVILSKSRLLMSTREEPSIKKIICRVVRDR